MSGELSEAPVARRENAAHPQPQIPGEIEQRHPGEKGQLFTDRNFGIDEGAGDFEVLVHRMARPTPSGASPRAASDSAVSYPRPPRICIASSTNLQALTVFHSLAAAASSRMS